MENSRDNISNVQPMHDFNELVKFLKVMLDKDGGTTCFGAWCKWLDPMGQGKLNFVEFQHAVRKAGYAGNIPKLWQDLFTRIDLFSFVT